MPGCAYGGNFAGNAVAPLTPSFYLANSLSGSGTPPAAYVQATDIVVLTTKSTLTSNAIPVVRMLLAADITALYQNGSGGICGLLGSAADDMISNSSGLAQAPPTSLGGSQFPGSYASLQYTDPQVGRSQGRVQVFDSNHFQLTPLYTGGGSVTLLGQYDGTLAGINISVTSGVTTYTIDPNATTKCVAIYQANRSDPNWGKLVAQNAAGPGVFWTVLPQYQQFLTKVNYTAQ
jgi:hypothetical protein